MQEHLRSRDDALFRLDKAEASLSSLREHCAEDLARERSKQQQALEIIDFLQQKLVMKNEHVLKVLGNVQAVVRSLGADAGAQHQKIAFLGIQQGRLVSLMRRLSAKEAGVTADIPGSASDLTLSEAGAGAGAGFTAALAEYGAEIAAALAGMAEKVELP